MNKKCSCKGHNLDKLIQPVILTLLTSESQCGYQLVQKIAKTPMLKGQKPDVTGVYRLLKKMENDGLVVSKWNLSETGPAKRIYELTDNGKKCLKSWVITLEDYNKTISLLLNEARKITK